MKHGYGWIHDIPDQRDKKFDLEAAPFLPPVIDMRSLCPGAYDQEKFSSCTGNALAALVQFLEMRTNKSAPIPSRMFIYYNERALEHTTKSDSGAMIRDGIKTLAKKGQCAETLWPYDEAHLEKKPPKTLYDEAELHRISSYQRISHDVTQMKSCLASGYPFVVGFTVYESFESDTVAQTGVVPMPEMSESVLGGHAVLVVGYNDTEQRFIVRNSWGSSWGMNGYFTMPYAYLQSASLSGDFWTIRFTQ